MYLFSCVDLLVLPFERDLPGTAAASPDWQAVPLAVQNQYLYTMYRDINMQGLTCPMISPCSWRAAGPSVSFRLDYLQTFCKV